jgi:hypothetical protein
LEVEAAQLVKAVWKVTAASVRQVRVERVEADIARLAPKVGQVRAVITAVKTVII